MLLTYIVLFGSTFVISLSGALMPGPLLSVTINESARERGWLSGPMLILGHAVLEILLILAIFLGLAPLIKKPLFFIIVGFTGSAFMIWMAVGMFRSLPSLTIKAEETEKKRFLPLSGALMSLANPYWTIWWATIGLGYIFSAAELGIPGIMVFFVGHIMADLVWYSFVSAAVFKGRAILPDTVYRVIVGICAGFLAGYGGFLIFMSIKTVINYS